MFEELCESADFKLFNKIMTDEGHILYSLLPPIAITSQNYNLHRRAHDRQIPRHSGKLTDCNFITRVSYKDILENTDIVTFI